jgi:hypothetical protein
MPKCINDVNKSYTGDEPSPKGLGYCAHAEKIGTIKKGKDGNIWIIKKTKCGKQRWIKKTDKQKTDKKLDCKNFVIYTKNEKKFSILGLSYVNEIYSIKGLELKKGFIHKWIDFNNFEKKETKIPDGYKKEKLKNTLIKKYCDFSKEHLTKKNAIKINHPNSKHYFIHDNGGRPFLVYISKNKCNIYSYPIQNNNKYYIAEEDIGEKWTYINKVATYKNPIKVFIGKSPEYGKDFDGNSILLQIENNRYVFIGSNIFEFYIKDDQIIEYYSPIGGSDVPYPIAISNKNIYFMLDMKYVPIENFSNINNKNEAYLYYYGNKGDEQLSKYAKPMLKTKIIQKRLY